MKEFDLNVKISSVHHYLEFDAFEGGPVNFKETVFSILNSIGKESSYFVMEIFARFGIKNNSLLYKTLTDLISKKCTVLELEKCLIDAIY